MSHKNLFLICVKPCCIGLSVLILLLFSVALLQANSSFPEAKKLVISNKSIPLPWMGAEEDLIRYYAEFKRDSALYYVEKYLAQAKKNNNEIDKAKALALKGYILMKYGEFAGSLNCFLAAVEIAESPGAEKNSNGSINPINRRSARLEALASVHHDWGNLLRNTEDFQEAKFHYFAAKKIADQENLSKLQALVNLSLGKLYIKLNKLDSALQFLKNAEFFSKHSGYLLYLGHIYKYTGDVFLEKDKRNDAKKYYYKTIQASLAQNNRSALSLAYNALTNMYTAQQQQDSSLHYAVLAKKELSGLIAQSSDNWNVGQANYNLYRAYELQKQPDSILKYLKLSLTTKDSLNKLRLFRLSELQSLTFQEQLRLKQLEKEKVAVRNRILTFSLLAGIGIFLLIASILYRNNQHKQKANKVLRQTLKNLKATQSQLVAQKERAEQGEQFRQRFLAHMSHEIRTPLHGIAGFTDLLLETSLSEKQRHWLSSIHHSTERLSEVVNDVLELSKLEAGELKLRQIPFSPANVAKDVQESLSLKAQHKGIELMLDLKKNVPAAIVGDPTRLYQILMNLAGNAVKFTEKGSVSIILDGDSPANKEKQVNLRFRVVDTGIGIPAEKITAVFGSFQQAGDDTVARFGGTGLGLTVTRDLLQLHGSEIQVESELGKGTTFSFVISYPLAQASELVAENRLNPDLFFSQALNILLVDDNELNREIAYEAVHRHFENANITEAVNGKVALEILENQDFDVVLMDMQMPEMNGTEATRHIRANGSIEKSAIPIIALTASATPEEIEKALESGMNRHLSKPFKPRELAAVIAEALSLKASKTSEGLTTYNHVSSTQALFDLSFLRDFTAGDETQMQYFIQKFIVQYPLETQKLELALRDKDRQAVYHAAHSFRPQLEFVGLKKAAVLTQLLEQGAQADTAMDELSTIFAHLKETLHELHFSG